MNRFVKIIRLSEFRFKRVKYYSVSINSNLERDCEFYRFLDRTESDESVSEDLNILFEWIEQIGRSYGAKSKFFRNEAYISDTSALPPPSAVMRASNIVVKGKLRLYCFRVSECVVFLYNGGIKTTKFAQDCPNVMAHFKFANLLTSCIQKAIVEKSITWNKNYTDINYSSDFRIEL